MALLDDVKVACRATADIFNDELNDLINAALDDMGITDIRADVLVEDNPAPLIKRAVLTYCKMNFGVVDGNVYDRLKASYDEQKSQLLMSSEYTNWGDSDV